MKNERRSTHECQCQEHDCQEPVRCEVVVLGCSHGTPHICDDCAADANCNGSALNPPRFESGAY